MPSTGFLGTRADVFVDAAIVLLVIAPFVMAYALRLAAQRRHLDHRNLQLGLLLAGIAAVLLLEGSLRFGGAAEAYAASSLYNSASLRVTFLVHLAVAVPTFIAWCGLATLSWRRYTVTLPGSFGRTHRRWGQVRPRRTVPFFRNRSRSLRHELRVLSGPSRFLRRGQPTAAPRRGCASAARRLRRRSGRRRGGACW